MSNKEELNETNEILYGKQTKQSGKSSGDELTDEILYGKRKTKVAGEPKEKSDADDLTDEILYGKKKPKSDAPKEKSDGEDLMDEILYGKKKGKKPVAEAGEEPAKKKKFNRDDYFGL